MIERYIFILHQGKKLKQIFKLSAKISSHFHESYDKLKDSVTAFIDKNQCHMTNENSRAIMD